MSGPLLDRIDLHVDVRAASWKELSSDRRGESSRRVARRVGQARMLAARRHEDPDSDPIARAVGEGSPTNARLALGQLKRFCDPGPEGRRLIGDAIDRLRLSARAYHRILRVSRTIADLGASDAIRAEHVAEAIQYRGADRPVA